MKSCPACQQIYDDDDLNFCLNDGATLEYHRKDDAPPTVFMNQARTTNEMNWSAANPPPAAPMSAWQSPSMQPSEAYMPHYLHGHDQTLPTISLVLGILSVVFICCYGGFYLGIPAVIVGFLALRNTNNNPSHYGGRGLAIAGLILGAGSFLTALLIILLAIIGNL